MPKTLAKKNIFGYFINPWDTWRNTITNFKSVYALLTSEADEGYCPSPSDSELDINLPIRRPIFGAPFPDSSLGVRLTWIGHASVLFYVDGLTILCDPIFSQRCSPSKIFGHRRYRLPPCQIQDLPAIDVVLISHNHYDHLDTQSVIEISKHAPDAIWGVPHGCRKFMVSLLPSSRVWEATWYDELPVISKGYLVKLVFTPTQHWSGRNVVLDGFASLWGSWAIIGPTHRVWFAGDTGYCSVFKEIGENLGPFDVSAIPIGAFKPRNQFKYQHIDPIEAVQIHIDVKSKHSIGIHWGTFSLGLESYMSPKIELTKAASSASLDRNAIQTLEHGQSFCFLNTPTPQFNTQ